MIERIGQTARWSEAVIANGIIFLAGHIATETRDQPVTAQMHEVLAELDKTLAKAGSDKRHLVSVTIFLADIADFDAMNAVWDGWVAQGHAPARATVEARLALPELRVEVTATAVTPACAAS